MSFAYLPLFTGDYLRDTQHLSMSEHGAYLKLLMHCWDQKGPAPLDERKLMGICNARSTDEIEAMRRVLTEFFVRLEDGWYNDRMQREIEKSEVLSRARSDAGRKGYEAKAKQLNRLTPLFGGQASAKHLPSTSSAPAKQEPLSPSPSPSLSPSQPKADASRGTRFGLQSLPETWSSYCKEKRPDLDPVAVFEQFADFWRAKAGANGRKADWSATWRVWVRNEATRRAPALGATRDDVQDLVRERKQREVSREG